MRVYDGILGYIKGNDFEWVAILAAALLLLGCVLLLWPLIGHRIRLPKKKKKDKETP